ncbi:hypothetical protein KA047_03660 [Candidatus Saccharibacteria bacterium]|nr:hypothetical protein [Candidatus Saccharibacteria bacterium]
MHIKKDQNGFHLSFVVIVLVVLGLIVASGWLVMKRQDKTDSTAESNNQANTQQGSGEQAASTPGWSWTGTEWKASGTVPACPSPLTVTTPVDINKAEAILYPGQQRSSGYKAHGGFRMSSASNNVTVVAPMDAKVTSGSRYIEMGEVQYLFEFTNDCGVKYRLDHLLVLTPEMQKLADSLPAAKENQSQTTDFTQEYPVKAGDKVATAVGFKNIKNVGFDFGLYDLRQKNAASKKSGYEAAHQMELSQAAYGLCWLDNLNAEDEAIARALPGGDQAAGKTSDYCL